MLAYRHASAGHRSAVTEVDHSAPGSATVARAAPPSGRWPRRRGVPRRLGRAGNVPSATPDTAGAWPRCGDEPGRDPLPRGWARPGLRRVPG